MYFKNILLALAASLTLGSASASAQGVAGWREPDPENVLIVETNKGRIVIELTPFTAPLNVARIKELTRRNFYDGRSFFRVIDDFMAQTGDPGDAGTGGSDLPNLQGEFAFKRGADLRFTRLPAFDARAGFIGPVVALSQPDALMAMMADGRVSAQARFCKGTLGMARANAPDSANSQFFIMRQTRPSLDGEYSVLGRVVQGLDVVRSIKAGEPVPQPQDKMATVRVLADLPEGARPRVLVRDTTMPAFVAQAQQQKAANGASFDICELDIEASVQ